MDPPQQLALDFYSAGYLVPGSPALPVASTCTGSLWQLVQIYDLIHGQSLGALVPPAAKSQTFWSLLWLLQFLPPKPPIQHAS